MTDLQRRVVSRLILPRRELLARGLSLRKVGRGRGVQSVTQPIIGQRIGVAWHLDGETHARPQSRIKGQGKVVSYLTEFEVLGAET